MKEPAYSMPNIKPQISCLTMQADQHLFHCIDSRISLAYISGISSLQLVCEAAYDLLENPEGR